MIRFLRVLIFFLILISLSGPTFTNITRPESLTVIPTAGDMEVSPAEGLNSTGIVGGPFTPAGIVYTIHNISSAPINWAASKTQFWITLSGTGGTLAPGASVAVTVSINSSAKPLAPNIYTDTLNFTNTTNGSGNTTRPVKLTVTSSGPPPSPGRLTVTPSSGLTSAGLTGGPFNPASIAFTLQNTGGTPISWAASKTQFWITLSGTSGTLAPGASVMVTVIINTSAGSLTANVYTGTVTFTNTTNGSGNTTRPVSLTVVKSGVLSVTPSNGFTSMGTEGGPFNPASIIYTLQNSGGAPINWTATKTQPWITVLPASGTLAAGATTTITVSIDTNANSLTENAHTDTVTFANTTNGSGNTTRPVSLVVTNPVGVLSLTPSGGLTSMGTEGGPFNPASIVYTLKNAGGAPINWTATKTQPWITMSATSSTLAAGATTTVTISINSNANSLAANPHTDTVTFTNTTNGNGNTTRPVSLMITTPPEGVLSVTPSNGLTSTGTEGGPFNPASIVYTLKNAGGAPINWTAVKTQLWITVLPESGTLAPGATATVTISINSDANSLTPNTYTDTLTFTNTTRPVSLTVTPPPGALSVTPSSGLTSTGLTGGPFNPASIVYTLQNTGGAPINWTASKTQPWITLSADGGTLAAGATVTVMVSINNVANSLHANGYTDTVTFKNTTNGIGNTTRPLRLGVG